MKAKIDKVNWSDAYPCKPDAEFSLTCSRDTLFLKFTVREEMTTARSTHNFDEVWKDSCCELFIMLDDEKRYYNLETSCNGYQIFSYRKGREGAEKAGSEIMDMIKCSRNRYICVIFALSVYPLKNEKETLFSVFDLCMLFQFRGIRFRS